jgi:hypothetical protein
MRTFVIVGLTALGMLGGLTSLVYAQRPGWSRAASPSTARAGYGDRFATVPDPLRPYATQGRAEPNSRPYARTPLTPPRDEAITRTSAPPPRQNYFPGLRTGQGPNRNYIDPRTLCVPGRRAVLHY